MAPKVFDKLSEKQMQNTLKVFWIFLIIPGSKILSTSRSNQNEFFNEIGFISFVFVLLGLLLGEGVIIFSLPILTYMSFKWRRILSEE